MARCEALTGSAVKGLNENDRYSRHCGGAGNYLGGRGSDQEESR